MNKYILFIIAFGVLISSCKKEPVIADFTELSALSYNGQIFAQPIAFNGGIVAVQNEGNSTYLKEYSKKGENLWKQNIDNYIIAGKSYSNIHSLNLKADNNNNIHLNLLTVSSNNEQTFKVVQFSSNGVFLNSFSDRIHQPDTIIHGIDTIGMTNREFLAKKVLCLDNGNTLVLSSVILINASHSILQLSQYNNNGQLITENYAFLPFIDEILNTFVDSNNNILLFVGGIKNAAFLKVNLSGNILINNDLTFGIIDVYSFLESSSGDYIFTNSTFNNNVSVIGLILSMHPNGELNWFKTYNNQIGWMLLSTTETSDGFLFSGFTNSKVLLETDWRTTFNKDSFKGVLLSLDLQGNERWFQIMQSNETSVGAIALGGENISLFGGKFNRAISDMFILKLNNVDGTILNQ